jgi:AsmA-like protein
MRTRRYFRFAFAVLAVLAAAWLLPVLSSTERYHYRLEARLQQILGQRVLFNAASLELLPRPGFSLKNATVLEDSEFGSEPFARVDRIECNLAVSELLHGRIEFPHLRLESASINLVRNTQGRWNFERLLSKVPGPASGVSGRARSAATLDVTVQDARINFKVGADKKPFTITQVDGNLRFDRAHRSISLDLTGTPLRTDLDLPSPGQLELSGDWQANAGSSGTLNAVLRTRGALLYDWVPLVSGRNPGIYGLIDADAHITGSLERPDVEAQVRLSQLRRWDSLPPAGNFPVNLAVKGRLDRPGGRALLERLDAGFGDTHVNLTGKLSGLGRDPVLDLTAGLDGSRFEDVLSLAERLSGRTPAWGLAGRADGRLTIGGPWSHPLYAGLLRTRDASLSAGSLRFPLSDASLRVDGRRIEFDSVRITAGPHLAILAEGALNLVESTAGRSSDKSSSMPAYELRLSTRTAPLVETVAFARTLGLRATQNLNLQGLVTVDLALTGTAWLPTRPSMVGHAELQGTHLWLPGLTRALDIPSARIEFDDSRIWANPLTVALGETAFTGRVERAGTRSRPWQFDLHSPALDLRQASSWFEAFGNRAPLPWFENIPGLSTLSARRAAGTGLFNALNAQGEFSTPALTYGAVTLRDFRGHVEVSRRLIRVSSARFRTSSGQGGGSGDLDLGGSVPHLEADFTANGVRVESWAPYLPPQLAGLRGSATFFGHFSSEGTSRAELESNLQGRSRLALTNLDFGRFDLLRDVAQAASWGGLAPGRTPLTLRSAELSLEVRNQRVRLKPIRLELGGALFELAGSCGFDRKAEFESTADLQHVNRRWLGDRDPATSRIAHFLLSGTLNTLGAALEDETARTVKPDNEP